MHTFADMVDLRVVETSLIREIVRTISSEEDVRPDGTVVLRNLL